MAVLTFWRRCNHVFRAVLSRNFKHSAPSHCTELQQLFCPTTLHFVVVVVVVSPKALAFGILRLQLLFLSDKKNKPPPQKKCYRQNKSRNQGPITHYEMMSNDYFLLRYHAEWAGHLVNINHVSNMYFQRNIIDTSCVKGDNQTAESMQIWGTACGLNTVHDLEWMCSQSANQLVMLRVMVSKRIPWVARGEIWIILHSHSAMTVFAGSQSRLIKQHYCKRWMDRKKSKHVLFYNPAYLIQGVIKSSRYHDVCTNVQIKFGCLAEGPHDCASSSASVFCAKHVNTRWKNLLRAARKHLRWTVYQNTSPYLIGVKQEAICNTDMGAALTKVSSWTPSVLIHSWLYLLWCPTALIHNLSRHLKKAKAWVWFASKQRVN